MSTNFFTECAAYLPHGPELHVIETVLLYSKAGAILCKAKTSPPKSMLTQSPEGADTLLTTCAIEYIAQAGAIARIIETRLADQELKAFGAVVKVSSLKKIVQNIGLDRPLLVYAEFRKVLPNVYEISGALRDADTNKDFATASFNVIEFN